MPLITHLRQIIEPVLHGSFRDEELVFAENSFRRIAESKLVILAHYYRFFGANFLAIAAENAAEHVDLENNRITFLEQFRLAGANFYSKRRTYARA